MIHTGFCLLLLTIQFGLLPFSFASQLYGDSQPSSDDVLSKYWGIEDTNAIVGRLFEYKIPPKRDAFKGTIVDYEVEGEEPNNLPKWLFFDKKRSMLEGVPTEDYIGDTQINVKAYDTKGKFVRDMFVIEVYPLENENINNKRKCKSSDEVMMLAIIIDKSLNEISPIQRVSVIRNLSRNLNIPQSTISLLPQISTVNSSPAYIPTDRTNDINTNSSILTWQIGCNERIWAEQLGILGLVKKYARDSTLADMLKLPTTQWRLIANFNPFRIRRDVTNGTMALDGSPDDNEDEDEGSDDDDDDIIRSSPTSSLQNPLSSLHVNNTSPFQQNSMEKNSTSSWIQSSSPIYLESSHTANELEDETTTDLDGIDSIFEIKNETVTLAPTPDFDSASPFKCFGCDTSESSASTEKTITTTISTRFPPRVIRNFEPLTIEAGKPYTVQIPEDIFEDESGDGNTRNLTLKLLQKLHVCKPETVWIELNSEKQTLLMLASSDSISKYELSLEAINSANMSSNTSIIIGVQYPPQERKINFEISLHMRLNENQYLNTSLQMQLLELIARLYGDANTNKIMLRHVTCDPFVLTWTNNTLSLDSCDNSTIFKLLNVLTQKEGSMDVNLNVHHIIGSLVRVEKITWQGKGLCVGVVPPARLSLSSKQNFSPVPVNHIDNITARVGELLVFRVPDDSFYEPDVANARDLKLRLTLLDQPTLPRDNWLQFDEKNFEIYGLPMNGDVGSMTYNLLCYDDFHINNDQKAARQTIEVKVEPAIQKPYNVEFSITLNSSYTSFEEFSRVPLLRRTLVKKLSELFGDEDTKSIVVSGYAPGSLIVIWHNKTLPVHTCPESEIEQLRKVLLTDRNELNERVNKVLGPEFQAVSALLAPTGICEGGLTVHHATEETPINTASQEIHSFLSKANFQYYLREYFVEIILPVIIIVMMMMFAGIVACILYRRQRRAKWNLNDETERRTYRSKGIPVIFQDELEERLETSNKSPIIMKEEKPPLPPPEYNKTLPMATTALLSDFDDPSYHQEGGSYSTRSVERNGRDKNTPTYRKPPPYVPS